MEPRLAGSAGWLAGCLLRYYRAGEQRWDTDGGGGGSRILQIMETGNWFGPGLGSLGSLDGLDGEIGCRMSALMEM